jgi:hypothetical protein
MPTKNTASRTGQSAFNATASIYLKKNTHLAFTSISISM